MKLSNRKLEYIKRHAAEKSPREIAGALGVPVGVVKEVLAEGGQRPALSPLLIRVAKRFWDRLPFWGLLFLAAATPFVLVPGLRDYADLPQTAFVQVGALVLALLWLVRSVVRKDCRILRTPLDLPLLCFLAWALVSLLWAHNRYEALVAWAHWAACGLVFLVTVNAVAERRERSWLLGCLFASGALVAFLGMLQYLFGLGWIPQSFPPAATFANKNMAVHYVILTLPLGAGLFLATRGRLWPWLVPACVLMCAFLFVTSTRAGWVALTSEVAMLSALLIMLNYGIRPVIAVAASMASAIVLGAVLVLALVLIPPTGDGPRSTGVRAPELVTASPSTPGDRAQEAAGPEAVAADAPPSSVKQRLIVWKNSSVMIRDHLPLGVGIGNWKVEYPGYGSRVALDRFVYGKMQWLRAHNDHLQILAELGLVGLGLYAWLAFTFLRSLWKLLGRETEGETRCAAMSIATGTLGVLALACFSFPLNRAAPPLALMICFGILGGALARGQDGERSLRLPRWAFVSAAAVVAILLAVHGRAQYRRLVADRYFHKMARAHAKKDWRRVINEGRRSYSYNPHRKKTLVPLAGAYIGTGRPEEAAALLKDVVRVYPNDLQAWNGLGVAHMEMGALDEALVYFKRTVEIRPEFSEGHNNIGAVYMRRGKRDEALESALLAVRHDPGNSAYLKNAAVVYRKIGDSLLAERKPAEALERFRRAIEHDPANAVYHHHAGVAAFHAGRHQESKASLEKALELRPDWAAAHKNLGLVLYENPSERADGIRHLKRALALDPEVEGAVEIRRIIEAAVGIPRR